MWSFCYHNACFLNSRQIKVYKLLRKVYQQSIISLESPKYFLRFGQNFGADAIPAVDGKGSFLCVDPKLSTQTFGLLDCLPLKVMLWHLSSSLHSWTHNCLFEFGIALPTNTLLVFESIIEPVPVRWVGALIRSFPWKNLSPHLLEAVFHVKNCKGEKYCCMNTVLPRLVGNAVVLLSYWGFQGLY